MLRDQTMELHFIRHKLETFLSSMLHDVQMRMTGMIDEVMQELQRKDMQAHEFRNFATTWTIHRNENTAEIKEHNNIPKNANEDETNALYNSIKEEFDISNKKHKVKNNVLQTLPVKVFRTRESYLTVLLEVNHMKAIYHIFYIIFLVFFINNITYDIFIKGSITFGLNTFKGGFEGIHYVFGAWILQKSFVFSIYYALKGWTIVHSKLENQKTLQRLWSLSCLTGYIASQIVFACISPKLCLKWNLPYVSACVLLLETIRMLMKMHSFVRTISARVLSGKEKLDDKEESAIAVKIPQFHKYLYFLFAPTLLYRDNYPRTVVIRWKFALARFFEVVAVAFLYSYIYERHIEPNFSNFGIEQISPASLSIKVFEMIMPCVILLLCGFYLLLHSWLNFTAEILRFGDRMFYRDWWTANDYEAYYRNWNVVVHDWLYEYIYKDCYTYIFKGSKLVSSLVVFMISALFHEYILGYALQIFFPVMFIFFGVIGVFMIFVSRYFNKNFGNIMIWFSMIYGSCILICLYSKEYFTSLNCPKDTYDSWSDVMVPHLWSCYFK